MPYEITRESHICRVEGKNLRPGRGDFPAFTPAEAGT